MTHAALGVLLEHKRVYHNEAFRLRNSWKIVWNGVVPVTNWKDKDGAQAQLGLLMSGYTVMCEDSSLRHVGACRDCRVVKVH